MVVLKGHEQLFLRKTETICQCNFDPNAINGASCRGNTKWVLDYKIHNIAQLYSGDISWDGLRMPDDGSLFI